MKNKIEIYLREINLDGITHFVVWDKIGNIPSKERTSATYSAEPKWRSPVTMGVLTLFSEILGIISLIPISKIVMFLLSFLYRKHNVTSNFETLMCLFLFSMILSLLSITLLLRRITKDQARYPLKFDFAISGYGNRLTIEKIHTGRCPICGGEMKYYSKPVEMREIQRRDGSINREAGKKIPALECKWNREHWFFVDPVPDIFDKDSFDY